MATTSDVEEELLEEQQRAEELERQSQQERLEVLRQKEEEIKQRGQAGRQNLSTQARGAAGQAAKQYVKSAAKTYAKEAAASTVAATSGIWGPILGILAIIALVVGLGIFILITITANCNAGGLTGFGARWGSWGASFLPGVPVDICAQLTITQNTQAAQQQAPGPITPPPLGKLTDAQARAQLAEANIKINAPQPRTSLEGINQATITEIIGTAKACDTWARSTARAPNTAALGNACNVFVTGGTESGVHNDVGKCTHISGQKVDVGLNGTLNTFIMTSGFAHETNIRGDKARQFVSNSSLSVYALESTHWDISVGC
jgi:hypothetical protein